MTELVLGTPGYLDNPFQPAPVIALVGKKGTDNLTVTTDKSVLVGDTIVISGKMALDKDFGRRYFYPVIIEDASIIVD